MVYGFSFDRTGNYHVALLVGVGCLVVGSLLLLLLGPYPRWAANRAITATA